MKYLALLLLTLMTHCATLPERYGACAQACEGRMQRFDATTDSCMCYKPAIEP